MTSPNLTQAPRWITATDGPLYPLEKTILAHRLRIEAWLQQQWLHTPPPLYASFDLRNAGFKLAPIDTNLFSAGFNNLHPAGMSHAIQAARAEIEAITPGCQRILLLPENHTRNLRYFESVAVLQEILQGAGYEVRLGSLQPDISTAQEIILASGRILMIEPLQRVDAQLCVQDFTADLIVLNNDLSAGVPEILCDLKQTMVPPLGLGWATRLKSKHFQHYKMVAEEFAQELGIDPWLLNPFYRSCDQVDFAKAESQKAISTLAEELLQAIQQKYEQYAIKQRPFLIIKADAGTYGMGVMTIYAADEIYGLNRKRRTHMSTAKGNRAITQVLIQEGIYTVETLQGAVAEPVIYSLGRYIIGGFYRLHAWRSNTENLNSPGMQLTPFAIAENAATKSENTESESNSDRFYVYSVISRLALVAAAREQQELKEKQNEAQ